jgi:hypothetical protein
MHKSAAIYVVLAAALLSTVWINAASAECAAFVCKHPTCRYQIQSSAGLRIVNLAEGERRIVSGLADDATYCDWQRGCVTPRRPLRSLGSCY